MIRTAAPMFAAVAVTAALAAPAAAQTASAPSWRDAWSFELGAGTDYRS